MIKNILTTAGFVEGKTFKETRFLKPPATSYAIYLDSYEVRGSDDLNLIKDHDYIIELYSYAPDPDSEKRIENALNDFSIHYSKADRIWIQEESLFLVTYSFSFVGKEN